MIKIDKQNVFGRRFPRTGDFVIQFFKTVDRKVDNIVYKHTTFHREINFQFLRNKKYD